MIFAYFIWFFFVQTSYDLWTPTHLLLCIGLFVESWEQEVEEDGMSSNEVGEIDWIIAIIFDEQLEGVDHYQYELHHLQNLKHHKLFELILNEKTFKK